MWCDFSCWGLVAGAGRALCNITTCSLNFLQSCGWEKRKKGKRAALRRGPSLAVKTIRKKESKKRKKMGRRVQRSAARSLSSLDIITYSKHAIHEDFRCVSVALACECID